MTLRHEKNRVRIQRLRDERLAKGLCVECGNEPHLPSQQRCDGCRKKNITRVRESQARGSVECEKHGRRKAIVSKSGLLCGACYERRTA